MQNYSRRQLKEDKFAKSAQGAVHWASDHRRNVLLAIAVILVLAIAGGGWFVWNNGQTDKANVALGKAQRTLVAPLRPAGTPPAPNEPVPSFASFAERGKQAQKELKSVADQYPYTRPGKIARYLEGVASMQAGDSTTAERQLKSVADSGDKALSALAKMTLASFYISANRPGEAAKIYKDVSDHPTTTVSKVEAQLSLAEIYESSDPKQAAALYQQIEKENPQTQAAQIAHEKVASAAK